MANMTNKLKPILGLVCSTCILTGCTELNVYGVPKEPYKCGEYYLYSITEKDSQVIHYADNRVYMNEEPDGHLSCYSRVLSFAKDGTFTVRNQKGEVIDLGNYTLDKKKYTISFTDTSYSMTGAYQGCRTCDDRETVTLEYKDKDEKDLIAQYTTKTDLSFSTVSKAYSTYDQALNSNGNKYENFFVKDVRGDEIEDLYDVKYIKLENGTVESEKALALYNSEDIEIDRFNTKYYVQIYDDDFIDYLFEYKNSKTSLKIGSFDILDAKYRDRSVASRNIISITYRGLLYYFHNAE